MELVLGIESSCDESSAAVVRNGREVLSEVTARQEEVHQRWGGIVPELASRKHTESILPVVRAAMAEANVTYEELTAIAVTNRPGLVGSLMVGISAAKALAWALQKPLVPVNHLEAHLSAVLLDPAVGISFPCLGLVVSGGHTSLYEVDEEFTKLTLLGNTRDDAAGEAFDKGARLLGLPYPGGPEIAKLARQGNARAIAFPRGLRNRESLDFSFSGLKTAIQRYLVENTQANPADVAASLQEAIVDAIVFKTVHAVESLGFRDVVMAGGVAANARLREKLKSTLPQGVRLLTPSPRWCTDNGAMIAALGTVLYRRGNFINGDAIHDLGPKARTEGKGA